MDGAIVLDSPERVLQVEIILVAEPNCDSLAHVSSDVTPPVPASVTLRRAALEVSDTLIIAFCCQVPDHAAELVT